MNQVNSTQFFGAVLKAIACTRNRNFDEAEYTHGVLEPAKQIRTMMKEAGESPVSNQQVTMTLDLLNQIFTTKGTEEEERRHYLNEIATRNNLQLMAAH